MGTLEDFLKLYEEHIADIHIVYNDEEIRLEVGDGWGVRQDNKPELYWNIANDTFGKYLDYKVIGFHMYLSYDEGYVVIRLEKGGWHMPTNKAKTPAEEWLDEHVD